MIDSDEIRLMSDALAADPGSLVFLQLGEALRQQGQLDVALRVAARGVERHAERADAHDLLARVAADLGEFTEARAAWETALTLVPGHPAAQKGLGFLRFQQGALDEAEQLLTAAWTSDPNDASLHAALEKIRAAGSAPQEAMRATTRTHAAPVPFAPAVVDARDLFSELCADDSHAALLLDADGLVVAGHYRAPDGRDLGADVGAQLSGVSDEATRAMRHLGVGAWTHLSVEAEAASVAMAPSGTGVLLVAARQGVPLGYVRRILDRALDRARQWMERGT